MVSVNEEIQNRTIKHMIFLERYKLSEVRRVLKILNREILPDIAAQIERRVARIIERGFDSGPETTARLKELERELEKLVRDMSARLRGELDLKDLVRHEINWQSETLRASAGFDLDTVVPSPRTVAALVVRQSFAGLTLDQWFDSFSRATQKNIMIAVQRGLVEGQTIDQISRRIRGSKQFGYTDGVLNVTRRQAEAITRTVVNHASNSARLEFLKANEDIIKSVKWVSTLDARTTVICAGLDGKVFPIDKGPRPPAHVNCRSSIVAVLKSARSLGLEDIPPGMRSSMNGQVPGSVTYGEWLKKQPLSVQEQVLGVKRAKLFNAGNLPIDRFTNDGLEPLTLKELRILEKNAFKKAKI